MNALLGLSFGGEELQNVLQIDFDRLLVKPNNFITKISTQFENEEDETILWSSKTMSAYLPMDKIFQSPTELCYGWSYDMKPGVLKEVDYVYLNDTYLKSLVEGRRIWLDLYVHHPGQFHRDKVRAFSIAFRPLDDEIRISTVVVSQVNIIRKRPDANIPCNPKYDSEDDIQWKKSIIRLVKCVPPFWKSFFPKKLIVPCKSSHQLRQVKELLEHGKKNVTGLYTPPCAEMSFTTTFVPTFVNVDHISKRKMRIGVQYPKETYLEITNQRAFGFKAFWSSVGGFLGIFLGYSLLQLPDIACKIMSSFQTIFLQRNRT